MPSGSLWSCPTLCNPVDCGLPGSSVREVLQARTLGHIGQHWLLYPSRALYFLLPYLPTPLSTWCCQNPCNPNSCTSSTPGPHRGKPKSSKAALGATPVDDPRAEVEIKPQLKPRAVWLRKKTQNLPTSYTSYRLNPHNQVGWLCVYGLYKRTLKALTKENSLVLITLDIGGKKTQE